MSKIGIGAWAIVLLVIPMSLRQRLESLSRQVAICSSQSARQVAQMADAHRRDVDLPSPPGNGIAVAQTGQFEAAQAIFDRDRQGEIGRRSVDRQPLYYIVLPIGGGNILIGSRRE